jgi:ADP-heptose:LPS heptosyltransferase
VALKKILVIRFSAMGDVALLLPVVYSLVRQHQDVEVTVVTRPKFASLFTDIERVVPFPADVDHTYTGILGIRELFGKLLRKGNYDVVVDMHSHIRTVLLRNLFKLFGTTVVVFDKGRSEKKAFTRRDNKATTPLRHAVERYQMAFEKAGYPLTIEPPPYFTNNAANVAYVTRWLDDRYLVKREAWIGIAPFAMHKSKIWPLEKYADVISRRINEKATKFFLFGGEKDIIYFQSLQQQFADHCVIVAGQLKIKQELVLMQQLDAMLCVDSSNMHLAALCGIPLLSIWGGTHPDVGFGPYGYGHESILQISRDELTCRPCSVYGKEKCFRGDFACLQNISTELVTERLSRISITG